eukprot:CAMPEP_0170190970 /NCGR_PEP_ID=MMETSP0040_2-20121228/50583_1 /TAXON_ID=641309 /ORGANISM="Lotharella oceanica, Strain CCMP622" /LENGTH=77 /DNA_ID=CAMNT_0010438943 /DNA_START=203 /DNA_END=436 /DNA_ORIENTATION=+
MPGASLLVDLFAGACRVKGHLKLKFVFNPQLLPVAAGLRVGCLEASATALGAQKGEYRWGRWSAGESGEIGERTGAS